MLSAYSVSKNIFPVIQTKIDENKGIRRKNRIGSKGMH